VRSAQTRIWPYSSLYLLPESTIAPKVHSLKHLGEFHPNWRNLLWLQSKFPFSLATQPLVCSILVLALPVFVDRPLACFPPRQGEGDKSGCFGLTCSVCPGRGRDAAVTVVMCGDSLQQHGNVGSCYRQRWVVHSPRGIGPG